MAFLETIYCSIQTSMMTQQTMISLLAPTSKTTPTTTTLLFNISNRATFLTLTTPSMSTQISPSKLAISSRWCPNSSNSLPHKLSCLSNSNSSNSTSNFIANKTNNSSICSKMLLMDVKKTVMRWSRWCNHSFYPTWWWCTTTATTSTRLTMNKMDQLTTMYKVTLSTTETLLRWWAAYKIKTIYYTSNNIKICSNNNSSTHNSNSWCNGTRMRMKMVSSGRVNSSSRSSRLWWWTCFSSTTTMEGVVIRRSSKWWRWIWWCKEDHRRRSMGEKSRMMGLEAVAIASPR